MTTFTVEQIRKINELAVSLQKNGKAPNLARGIEQAKDMLIPPGERMRSAKELASEVEKIKRELESHKGAEEIATPDLSSMGQVADFTSKEFGPEKDASLAGMIPAPTEPSVVLDPSTGDSDDDEMDSFEDLSDIDQAIAYQQGTLGEVEKEDDEAIQEEVEDPDSEEIIDEAIEEGISGTQEGFSSTDLFVPSETPPLAENDGLLRDTGYQTEDNLELASTSLLETPETSEKTLESETGIMTEEPATVQEATSDDAQQETVRTQIDVEPVIAGDLPMEEMAEGDGMETAETLDQAGRSWNDPAKAAVDEHGVMEHAESPEQPTLPQDIPMIDAIGGDERMTPGMAADTAQSHDVHTLQQDSTQIETSEQDVLETTRPAMNEPQNEVPELPSSPVPAENDDVPSPGGQEGQPPEAFPTARKDAAPEHPGQSEKKEGPGAEPQKKDAHYDDPSFDISKELKTVEELFTEEEKKEHLQGKEEKFIRDED